MSKPKNNVYTGRRTPQGAEVLVNGRPLHLRLDLRNHSPTGFAWGYGGSGPAQLALAILANEWGSNVALEWYQDFKREFISGFDELWVLTSFDLEAWRKSRVVIA